MVTSTTHIDGDSFVIEIPLGSPSQDRALGVIQFVVMVVGLIVVLPDFRMFRFGLDASLVIRSAFAILWIAIGLLVSVRTFIFPPIPILIRFGPDFLRFDSGRAGLRYLGDNFENNLTRLYQTALQWRKAWLLQRPEIRRASCKVVTNGLRIVVHCDDRTYDLGVGIPDSHHYAVRDAILAWIHAEPSDAPEHASRAFSNGQSTARAG